MGLRSRPLPTSVLALALAASAGGFSAGCADADANRAARALEVTDLVSYWTVLGRDSEGNNYIRPAVRFRVTNGNPEPIQYVQAMSVFRRTSAPEEAWGTGYLHSVAEDPIGPGAASAEHILRSDSNYLSQAPPERMFENLSLLPI